jgi:hypothetical protein
MLKATRLSTTDDEVAIGWRGLLCAITLQAVYDARKCNGYGIGVDALHYLNFPTVQDLHDLAGINIRRKWDFVNINRRNRVKRA